MDLVFAAMYPRQRNAQQAVHTITTIGNGAGAILPVLAVSLAWLLEHPEVARACLRGERTWQDLVGWLLAHRALFPFDLPGRAAEDTWIGRRRVPKGTQVLLSLAAAAHHPDAPPGLAFGAGPHRCPGDKLRICRVSGKVARVRRRPVSL